MSELDKAMAALKLGDVLLTNLSNENKKLKEEKEELFELVESLLNNSEVHMAILENRFGSLKLDLNIAQGKLKKIKEPKSDQVTE